MNMVFVCKIHSEKEFETLLDNLHELDQQKKILVQNDAMDYMEWDNKMNGLRRDMAYTATQLMYLLKASCKKEK